MIAKRLAAHGNPQACRRATRSLELDGAARRAAVMAGDAFGRPLWRTPWWWLQLQDLLPLLLLKLLLVKLYLLSLLLALHFHLVMQFLLLKLLLKSLQFLLLLLQLPPLLVDLLHYLIAVGVSPGKHCNQACQN